MFGRQVTAWGSLGAEFNFTSNDLHAVTWRLQIFKFRAFLIFPVFFQTLLSYSLGQLDKRVLGGWSPKQNGHGMLRSTQPPPTRGAPNLIALCSLSGQAGDVRSVAERFQTKDKMTPTMIFFHLKIVLKPLKVAISDSRDIKNRILYNFGVHLNRFSTLSNLFFWAFH